MHPKQLIKLLAFIMIVVAFAMLFPMYIAYRNNEISDFYHFLYSIIGIVIPSLIIVCCIRKTNYSMVSQKDGFLFTVLTWVLATSIGAIPLAASNFYPSYADAFFEVMSGFTTTGSTTLANIEGCSKSILLWRSMTNWLGGMGIVVLFIALLPALGYGGGAFNLIGAETVGPVKGKLTPKTRTTARALWLIYIALTVIQVGLLLLGDLPLFDAITISFSTLSTAGFSIKGSSIGAYNSTYVEIIVTVFMLAAAVNFSLYYKIITGKIKDVFKDSELRWFLLIFAGATVMGAITLCIKNVFSLGQAFVKMAFQVASVVTTTGFTSANYLNWPSFCKMALVLMMFVGGCAGSTGGGMKVARIRTIVTNGSNIIKQKVHPSVVLKKEVEPTLAIFSFCAVYIGTWLIGAFVISLTGLDILDCLSTSICCLGNIGTGFAKTTNGCFNVLPAWTKYFCSFLMLAGRLELFTLYTLFNPSFWKR